jgi:hypothetical protein
MKLTSRFPRTRAVYLVCASVLLLAATIPASRADVIISEFEASNTSGLRDEDGASSDWIELFNASTTTANLDGWFLTDSKTDLTRWRLPATNLPPNGFLVVFASGKSRAVPGLPLHTSFSLNGGGEYLALVKPDGVTIASEFAPQFPQQYQNISYGLAQQIQTTRLLPATAPARVFIPTNGLLGLAWTTTTFDDSAWLLGTNGVGFETYVPGFAVRNARGNGSVCDLATAEAVLGDPSRQSAVFNANPATINYLNTGDDAHFAGGLTFPGFTIGVDEDNFVTEAKGVLTIPATGNWTFGVNSDDGFRVTIGDNVLEYPSPRGPADTLSTFALAAGDYPLRLVFYECGGGSELEFFAAQGAFTAFGAGFQLVGATGGLPVRSLPGGGGGFSLRPLILTDVQSQMAGKASSAYVRIPFVVSDPSVFSTLTLRLKYNDAFIAYLNGTEVARRNFSGPPQWNSVAATSRALASALTFEDLDITPFLSLIKSGTNILALHAMNEALNGGQFVVLSELVENKFLGQTNMAYFAVPTPGAYNSGDFLALVDDLKFNPARGWFLNTNFFVTITSSTPDVSIRYTTNGSAPSITNGFIYSGPVPVSGTTVLRAIAYRDGFQPSPVGTHSYIFLDQVQLQSTNKNYVGGSSGNYTLNTRITQAAPYRDTFTNDLLSLPTLSISTSFEDFFGPAGIWSNPQGQGVAWERPCSAEYMRPDGKKGFHVNCGLRIQGGVSRTAIEKHSLRLLFKSAYGPSKLDYDLYPDSSVTSFDTLSLHAGFNDHWLWVGAPATLHRDLFCRETQNALGGYAAHGTWAHLYINGLYWGVYNIGEKSDDSFAASYLGGEKEEYDALTADEFVAGTPDAYNTMLGLADAGLSTDTAYTNISRYLNIPNFIDYMLMNFYVANVDWPFHNWTAARRRLPGAGFHFFSWDAEWVLGVGSDPTTDRTGIGSGDGSPGRLYNGLRMHPEFRLQFADRAQKHCFNGGALSPTATDARWAKVSSELDRGIVGETARWGAGYTRAEWLSADAQVRSWFSQRTATLVSQLKSAGLFPQVAAPGLAPFGGLLAPGTSLSLSNSNPSATIYYTLDGSDPRLWGGAISPAARTYSAPLTLDSAMFLRARARIGSEWSPLVEAGYYVLQDFSALAITEIMYHPRPFSLTNSDDVEFVELKNTGNNPIELTGLEFSEGLQFSFTNGTYLPPGDFFVLVRDPANFALRYPGIRIDGVFTGKLDNAGERITLAHVLGTNVLSFSYGTIAPWPVTPDGYGFSLVLRESGTDPSSPYAWRASSVSGGSPGADDPVPQVAPILINELLTHTDPPQVDAIELYNPTQTNVDVGGWFLTDDVASPFKFRIPKPTTIPARGFVTFGEPEFNQVPGATNSFALSSWGESLYLFSADAATNLTGYSHGLEFGPAANGVSFGRYVISTGEEYWPAQVSLTLGSTNSGPRLGPIVINEIAYHPPPGYDEFVELYNLSSKTVPLYDPDFPANGWKLSGLGYTFSNTISLDPGAFLLVVPSDPELFRSKYSVSRAVQILGPCTGVLQDGGERLRLERPDKPDTNGVAYIVVDEVRYDQSAPWPATADGQGPSLQRRAPALYGNEPTNWFASGITPGATNAFNLAPTCALLAPNNGSFFTAPLDLELRAAAADPDGLVLSVDFYDGDAPIGSANSAPFLVMWTNVPVGEHHISARARDNRLAVASSTAATITVGPPPAGLGTGLRGDYYDDLGFTGTLVQRTDATVAFDWGGGQPDPGIGADTFSVRWTGKVQPLYSGTYAFYTVSDDGVRLWVNNQLIIDNWTDHGPTENAGFISLDAGRLYDVKMEFYENGGGATAKLLWAPPNGIKEIIPTTQLYPPGTANQAPFVSILSPAAGERFVSGAAVSLQAQAFDPDGGVASVVLYAGSTSIATLTNSPYTCEWSRAIPGPVSLSAVATDNTGLSRTSSPVTVFFVAGLVTNISLVSTGSTWSYRDVGTDPGPQWSLLSYEDSNWLTGPARLGYGNGGEGTVVGFGPNAAAKYITTWFRRDFVVLNPTDYEALTVSLLRDDGVVLYLNGSPVYRDNLPALGVTWLTPALTNVSAADGTTNYYQVSIDPGYLVPGRNVLAAEIHQSSASGQSIAFDLELAGKRSFLLPSIVTQPQSKVIPAGSTLSLFVTVTGTAPLAYQWFLNGAAIPGATASTYTARDLEQNGSYSVGVSNPAGSVTSLPAFVQVVLTDTDADGMPDGWELAHGLDPAVNDAGLDPDHDGMTNLQEYLAGTNPQEPASALRLEIEHTVGAIPTLRFQAAANRSYTVQSRTSLGADPWSKVADFPADLVDRTVTLEVPPVSAPAAYFRLVTPAQ